MLQIVCFLVTVLVEFFCDRLKDHFSIIPHVLSGLLALVGYYMVVNENSAMLKNTNIPNDYIKF